MSGVSRWLRPVTAGLVVLALIAGGALGWAARGARGGYDHAAMQAAVRETLLDHPEILPEAMERLRGRQDADRLAVIRADVERPFPGAVLGNPNGARTLVEFTDFACGFCRQSVADVAALTAEHPDVKVVVRQLPILSPRSAEAARWGLAAAAQGKYPAFHQALFAAGALSPETIAAAASRAGLDLARARAAIADPAVDAEIKRNLGFARTLGFEGTPSWVAGGRILSGAVGKDQLAQALAGGV